MAFLGVLPEAPSFGQQLSRGLGAGLGNAFASVGDLLSESVKERMKSAARSQSLLNTLAQLGGGDQGGGLGELTPEQQGLLATQFPEFVQAYQKGREQEEKTFEKGKAEKVGKNALTRMEKLIDEPGIGMLGAANLTDEARRNRGEFDSLQPSLLMLLKTLTPRGITQQEFQVYVDKYIPNWHDTQETIRGKLRGFENLISESRNLQEEKPKASAEKGKEPMVKMKAPDGKTVLVPKNQVKAAMEAGGQVVR